jgi:hypothetical protein
MHLDLIHGLFITQTKFRLISTSTTAFMYTNTDYNIHGAIPLLFLSPLADSLFAPLSVPFTYLETLLVVTGSVHLGLRLLVN